MASSERQSPLHRYEFPAGFRFRPTAIEILKHYLLNKVLGQALPYDGGFEEMDIYRHDPDQLPIDISDGHSRWAYFFVSTATPDEDDYDDVRSTPHGLWRLRRPDRPVKDDDESVIGYKRSFVFYYTKADGRITGTGWMMNEYRLSRKFYGSKDASQISACEIYILMEERASNHDYKSCSDTSKSRAESRLLLPVDSAKG
ncbi:(No apical meristem) protein [Musa troglodytarum]|uniref:(No apical meristem) protein n=1 Tax=Musa troglodytarum TaxID=320322 RepID=A0A9E7JKY5_9LILI|nr:(No apical meristem) protein [Musa troglodytarum]